MPKKRMHLKEYEIANAGCSDGSCDKTRWTFDDFTKNFKIIITNIDNDTYSMEFDMVGVDVSIANALRRILIAEVPTMAIDKVFMYNNTSIVQDEVLAHRLGLVPIKADPRHFEYRQQGDEEGSTEDTIQFQLKIKCTRKLHLSKNACTPKDLYDHSSVYTKDLKFVPKGDQQSKYGEIRPVHEDILLAKLRPGHEIDLIVHCVKGVGSDHAKFSPVATATYRLLPEIQLLREVTDENAHLLQRCFSDGVIEIVNKKGKEVAKVANARKDTCSRNVFQYDELKDAVSIDKVKDYFLFSIESTGALSPDILFLEAVDVLKGKCRHFLNELKSLKMEKRKAK